MTERDFKKELRDGFIERFEVTKENLEDDHWEVERDWQDAVNELADMAVPIYTQDMYELWMELGRPEVDDPGLIEGVTDIDRIVATALYCYASGYLYEVAEEFGFK